MATGRWSHRYTHHSTAARGDVWSLLRDVDGWGAWNAGIETIRLDGPLAVGTTFRMTPPGEEPLTSHIAALEEGRLVTDVTELGEIVVRVEHHLDDAAQGAGTTITYAVDVTAPSDEEAEQVGRGVSADFPDVMAALAAVAEGRAGAPVSSS